MKRAGVISALALLALGAAGFWLRQRAHHHHPPGKVPLEPIDAASLRVDVRTLTGLDPGELAHWFDADAAVEAFAARAAGDERGADAKARAICAALRARKQKGAFVEWSRVDPRDGPPLTASKTLQAISKDGAARQLYPLEIASLAVASLRSLDVPALLAEVYKYPNERNVVDPSGRFGYFAVYVPASGSSPARVYDAYGGRANQPARADYAPRNDAQAVGAALAIRALDELSNVHDPKRALEDARAAATLLPDSPSAHCAYAAVLTTRADSREQTARELELALKLRPDAARRLNLAQHALANNNAPIASPYIALLLQEAPDYAQAYVLKAAMLMMVDENAYARKDLEHAERLDPALAQLPQMWAQLDLRAGDYEHALAHAAEGVKRRPKDPQPLLILALVEQRAGRHADARKHARALLQLVAPEDREARKHVLMTMLGNEILDEPAPDASVPLQSR